MAHTQPLPLPSLRAGELALRPWREQDAGELLAGQLNAASLRTAQAAGFVREGCSRSSGLTRDGAARDHLWLASVSEPAVR